MPLCPHLFSFIDDVFPFPNTTPFPNFIFSLVLFVRRYFEMSLLGDAQADYKETGDEKNFSKGN